MSDTKILSREELHSKLNSGITADVWLHDLAQRAKLQRLTDLVRYSRHALHADDLISNEEYSELMQVPGSVARLESYDEHKARLGAEVQRLTAELETAKRERDDARAFSLNYEHATKIERAETDAELADLRTRLGTAEPTWRSIESAPKDGTPITSYRAIRYLPYKHDGKRQMRADGRWQERTDYGWKNCDDAPDGWLPLPEQIDAAISATQEPDQKEDTRS